VPQASDDSIFATGGMSGSTYTLQKASLSAGVIGLLFKVLDAISTALTQATNATG